MLLIGAVLSLCAWVGLIFFHGRFWVGGPWLSEGFGLSRGAHLSPDVTIIVPARDEAGSIASSLTSLLEQDYKGRFRVILVDDESEDSTVHIAHSLPDPHQRLTIVQGKPHPSGWSGKLWAVNQGEEEALRTLSPDGYVLLTDADIVHAPDHLSSLVARAQRDKLDMVSEMVKLNCVTFWERALVPAFVYFFALLYPFRQVADPRSPIAGAAGGTILLKRPMLEKIGGIRSLRHALIDDCTLGAHVKKAGGRLYLGLSEQAWSIRTYQRLGDIWHMIARNAYVQLRYSPWRLLGALLGMLLVWLLPIGLVLFSRGKKRWIGATAYTMSCVSFVPTLRWFNLSLWRVLPLPLVASFYSCATIGSAVNHYSGAGVKWRGRFYGDET